MLPRSKMFPSSRTVASPKCSFRDPNSFLSKRGYRVRYPRFHDRLLGWHSAQFAAQFAEHHRRRFLLPPDLHPTLHRTQEPVRVLPGMCRLKPLEQLAARVPRLGLEPGVQLLRHLHQRIGPPSAALRLRHRLVGDVHKALLPHPHLPQQPDRVESSRQLGNALAHLWRCSGIRQQPLAGRGRRMVTLADTGALAPLRRQLERGLEEVHEQSRRRVEPG